MSSEPASDGTGFKYWAFLSYSHQDNLETRKDGRRDCIRWAEWLHDALERYRVPKDFRDRTTPTGEPMPERFFPVFQDEKELPINADLGESIRKALEQAPFLIVICSPRSATSRYVNEEVRYFKTLGRQNRIMTLMIDGEPNASLGNKSGYTAADECFCPALRFSVDTHGEVDVLRSDAQEPIAGDVRVKDAVSPRETTQRDLSSHQPVLEYMKLKLIAGLMGVGFDELAQRDKVRALEEARIKARRARRIIAVVAGLGVIAVGAAAFAWWQRGVAQHNAGIAAKNEKKATENADTARRTLSGSDFFRADELIASGKPPEAMAFLARAIHVDPQNHAAARRALMLLQEQPWFLPEQWLVPEKFRIEDARFLDRRSALFMVSDKTGIGFCDDAGRLLHPMRQREGSRFSDYSDFSCGLSEDGRLYFTEISGKPRQYWDVRDGKPQPAPASAREGPETAALRKAVANKLQLDPSETEHIVISSLGAKAAVPTTDTVIVVRISPLAIDSVSAKELSSVLAFDPVTDDLVQVGGSHGEYGHDGVVSIPARRKRFDLTDQGMAIRFFPMGRMFVTEQLGGMLHLWDIAGGASGEVVPASEAARDVEFESHGLDVAPDGRAIVSRECRLRAIGRLPIAMRAEDNPADRELRDLQKAVVPNPRVTVPPPEVEAENGAPKTPPSPKPIDVEHHNPDRKVVLEASEGFDSAESIGDQVVCARSSDGTAGIWNSATGKKLNQFNIGAGGHVRAATKEHVLIKFDDGSELWRLDPPRRIGRRLPVSDPDSFDVHPDGTYLLVSSQEYWVELLDTTTGEPVGDRLHTSMRFPKARFAPDGSYFVTECNNGGSNDVEYRLWDTATLRPLSKPISSARILADAANDGARAYFGRDGRIYLCAAAEEAAPEDIYLSFDIPPSTRPVPEWLGSLLEAVCARRVAESNALVDLPSDERRRRIAAVRELVAKADPADTFAAVVRWWLDEDPDRLVSPHSAQSVTDYVAKRLAAGTMLDLALAAHAAPENAAVLTRIAALHRADSAKAQADGDPPRSAEMQARADYYSRLALRLAPASDRPEANAPAPARKNLPPPAAPSADAEAHFVRAEGLRKIASKISPDALALYRKAAELGHAGAMHRIGVAYALGESVSKDEPQAVEWYRKAAEKGFAEAQYDLGVRYILGLGVPKDEPTGLEWYRKAAAQGWQEAIDALRQHDASRK